MRFADVETLLFDFFIPRVAVPFVSLVPEDRPAEFVRLWRNGGPASNRIVDRPLVTIEGWATDSTRAAEITGECRSLLFEEYTAMALVRTVTEITGPYSIPDPETGTPRYRFTAQLTVRAHR